MKWLRTGALLLLALVAGPMLMAASGNIKFDKAWYEADRSSAGLAPAPATTRAAVVEVYAARAFNWRGAFAVHTWIATKDRNADSYRVYQVTTWRQSPLPAIDEAPDRKWFGNTPIILKELRGAPAQMAIARIRVAAAAYPFSGQYRIWPGPNSNTFTAWLIRHVPALNIALPTTAIGKDYLGNELWARAPSGTGYQISIFGLVGMLAARREGLEMNVLGLTFGIDPAAWAIELPGLGRIGWNHERKPTEPVGDGDSTKAVDAASPDITPAGP